jgi:hypothetical protein
VCNLIPADKSLDLPTEKATAAGRARGLYAAANSPATCGRLSKLFHNRIIKGEANFAMLLKMRVQAFVIKAEYSSLEGVYDA